MRFTLISPRIAIQKGDLLGSGVPYWPLELAVLAGFLRERREAVTVLDLLGASPRTLEDRGDHYLQGRPLSQLSETSAVRHADTFIVFAMSSMSHGELLDIIRTLRAWRRSARIAVLENAQAVTAYALSPLAPELVAAGADALLCGEPYGSWAEIQAYLDTLDPAVAPANIIGAGALLDRPVQRSREHLPRYPVPAWELFNVDGYWSLPYAHGPRTARYLPLLASRGCPLACDFCVMPATSGRRWHARAPAEVVDEMLELRDRFEVRDFQVEDVNPTVNPKHWEAICQLLIERDAGIRFYFVSGTKAESVPLGQVSRLAQAGCRYLSFSPESGSAAVLQAIGKSFDYEHGLALVARCKRHGIVTQACFIVGHPAESAGDHRLSVEYLEALVGAGLDEVAVFVVAPLPGSAIHDQRRVPILDPDALVSFSPRGRADWATAAARRRELIAAFFRARLRRGAELWRQGARALLGVPQSKMENVPRRVLAVGAMILQHRLRSLVGLRPGMRR